MAFLKFKIKHLDSGHQEIRAYAYDSYVLDNRQIQFPIHKFGIFKDKSDAKKVFKKWLETYRELEIKKRIINPALKDFENEYLEKNERLTGKKTQCRASLKHLTRHLGLYRLSQITPRIVIDYRDKRKKEPIKSKGRNKGKFPSPKTINHELSTLSSVLRKALELELISEHPFLKYGISLRRNFFLKVSINPRPALTRQEFTLLMENMSEEKSKIITLLYAITGMRQGELIALRLTDVDLDQNRITFRSPKTRDFRTIAIPTILKPVFKKLLTHIPLRTQWQERRSTQKEFIFCNQMGEQQKTPGKDFMTQAAQRAGIQKHVTPHVLRHSFASHAANLVNIWELKELMGHKNITTTEIYVKTFKAPDVKNANRIAESFGINSKLLNSIDI